MLVTRVAVSSGGCCHERIRPGDLVAFFIHDIGLTADSLLQASHLSYCSNSSVKLRFVILRVMLFSRTDRSDGILFLCGAEFPNVENGNHRLLQGSTTVNILQTAALS